jgi:hypothetical protein
VFYTHVKDGQIVVYPNFLIDIMKIDIVYYILTHIKNELDMYLTQSHDYSLINTPIPITSGPMWAPTTGVEGAS